MFGFKQKQQSVAVGPGNAHCMSIRQVSLLRDTRGPPALLLVLLPCISNLIIKNELLLIN